jgi:sugar lactone lactonase YvrE
LLICDLSDGIVWQADPKTGKATVFMNTGQGSNSGLNALTFDKAGNVYVSDSIYRRVQCQPDFPGRARRGS